MNQEALNKHLAAGAQLSVARTALNQLASTLELMEGESDNLRQLASMLCLRLEEIRKSLSRQLQITVPEASETTVRAIYESPPPWTREILPQSRPDGDALYSWISQDYQRSVMAGYILSVAVPGQEGKFHPVSIALTRNGGEAFLASGAYTVQYPIQQSQELMVNFAEAVKQMQG